MHTGQPIRRIVLGLLVVLAIASGGFAGPTLVQADQPDDPSVYEGRLIRRIDLLELVDPDDTANVVALEPALAQLASNQIRSGEGLAYRQETVSDDISRLNRLGRFSRIQVLAQLQDDGTVVVSFLFALQRIIADVQVVGNRKIKDVTIAREISGLGLEPGAPVDPIQIGRAARRIESLYQEKGYYLVHVSVDDEELRENGVVLFQVVEGDRIKITAVRFDGNRSFTAREIHSAIKTRTANLFRRAPLDNTQLAQDVAAIIQYYRDRGYLDVEASHHILRSPNNREAIVTFIINEGALYTIRSVRVEYTDAPANPAFTSEQVTGLMEVSPGDVYGITAIGRSVLSIQDAYGELGYHDVQVNLRESRDLQLPEVDLVLFVRQGDRTMTGEVVIHGNELTRHEVILRQMRVKPDRPLSISAIRESEQALRELRLFDPREGVKVTVQAPDPIDPAYRDVLVEVQETNTGNFNIGAAVSSDSGVRGTLQVIQRNFDITDVPDSFGELFTGKAFRGGGQTLSLNMFPGDQTEEYSLSLTEPYLFESDYSGTGSVFYRSRDFSEYDEERYGVRGRIARRFGERWIGGVAFRAESVNLQNISADSAVDIFEVQDRHPITGVGFDLTRTTTDSRVLPTRGTRIAMGVEQVGVLGGDYDFTKLSVEHDVFLSVHEDFLGRKTVLSFKTEANWIPQDVSTTPLYERQYLGGRSFRGFDFRGIGPVGIRNDTGLPGDDHVGGTWSFFWGAEIKQPILEEVVSIVGFVDTGTVTNEIGFDEYRLSVGTGIRVYIQGLSPVPLAFDFGFPLIKEDTDQTRVFTFTVDIPY